jgi:hypothetical protein
MFVRRLTTRRRLFFGGVAVAGAVAAVLCGALAVTEPQLPPLARGGLLAAVVIGVCWSIVAGTIAWRGVLDLKLDNRRIAILAWVFAVLNMVFFLAAGFTVPDRPLGLMMIANGLAFLIGGAVYWLTYCIERMELAMRERLLQLELRLAEWGERRGSDARVSS